jgi:ammonia channel protein AmtB
MVKNVIDVVFGGLSYWALGFGLSFGDIWPNPVIGIGRFFYDPTSEESGTNAQGLGYASFLFQMSFATTTATIVSGCLIGHVNLFAQLRWLNVSVFVRISL